MSALPKLKSDAAPNGHVPVGDYCLWIKHIIGNDTLKERLFNLPAEQSITLNIGGHEGVWVKMKDGKDGRPSHGLKPVGSIQTLWKGWYKEDRGKIVSIDAVEPAQNVSDTERAAAWAALWDVSYAGWRSEGPYGTRDALYGKSDDLT